MTKLTPVKITYLKIFQRNLRTGGWACCMSQGLQVVERMWMDCFTLLDNVEIPTCVESYMARGRELESTRRVQGPRQGYTCGFALRAIRQTGPGIKGARRVRSHQVRLRMHDVTLRPVHQPATGGRRGDWG